MQHMTDPPPHPSSRASGIPPEVDDLTFRCLAKKARAATMTTPRLR
jgi:hypothetical protein